MKRNNLKFENENELAAYLKQQGSARIKSVIGNDSPNAATSKQAQVSGGGRKQRPVSVPEQSKGLTLETGKTKLIRQGDKQPNMTEKRFELLYILPRYNLPVGSEMKPFVRHRFEEHRIRLANGAWYKIDWWCTDSAGQVHAYEIKGRDYVWERTKHSVKLAADRYPEYNFYLCVEDFGGQWLVEKVKR